MRISKDDYILALSLALENIIFLHKDISRTLINNLDNEIVITECKNILKCVDELESCHNKLADFFKTLKDI